jgi:thiol:disulfide interchange protein DsbA
MNRRDSALWGSCLALAGTWPVRALAQGSAPAADHVTLPSPLPVTLAPGKRVEVVGFFWYECPHCYAFEPSLETWVGKLAADVQFRRVPVGFTRRHEATMLLYYALESLGQIERLHRAIFDAIHRDGRRLLTEADQLAFVTAQGVDGAQFTAALKSQEVGLRAVAAKRLTDAYRIEGVPSLGVHGRYVTAPSMVGSHAKTLAVADALVGRVRLGG